MLEKLMEIAGHWLVFSVVAAAVVFVWSLYHWVYTSDKKGK